MIRLVFLGKLADLAGGASLDRAGELTWPELVATLPPALGEAVATDATKVAVNGMLVADKATLVARSGDEIAFLPPVSGG